MNKCIYGNIVTYLERFIMFIRCLYTIYVIAVLIDFDCFKADNNNYFSFEHFKGYNFLEAAHKSKNFVRTAPK